MTLSAPKWCAKLGAHLFLTAKIKDSAPSLIGADLAFKLAWIKHANNYHKNTDSLWTKPPSIT
jgi:hypothetical protein